MCFHSAVARGFNTFAFFTILSNLIVGATTLLLASKPDLNSAIFKTFRLTGLVAITVTGIVYHVALADIFELAGVHQFGNQLVHTVVPLLAARPGRRGHRRRSPTRPPGIQLRAGCLAAAQVRGGDWGSGPGW